MSVAQLRELDSADKITNHVSILPRQISCKSCDLQKLCSSLAGDTGLSGTGNTITEHPRPLHRGEHLFRQGDLFRHLYVVRTGSIKLYLTSYDGSEQTLNFYFPGELLSLDSIASQQHKTSAIALDTTSVCRLPFEQVKRFCHQQPELYDQLFLLAGREIANEHNMTLTLGQKQAEEKFAAFLLDIARRYKNNQYDHRQLELCMSRHDIANYLCLADETISRLFSKFSAQGILNTNRKFVAILDFARLREIANMDQGRLQQASN